MKPKRVLLFTLLSVCCISCKHELPLNKLNELNIQRPGFFILSDNYLYVSDIASTDSIMQVFDKTTGVKLADLATSGWGADRFATHQLGKGINGTVIVNDLNSLNSAIYDASNLKRNEDPCIKRFMNPLPQSAVCQISANQFLYLNPDSKKHLFKIINEETKDTTSVGTISLQHNITNQNRKELYSGELFFDADSSYLLYRGFHIPTLQLYKIQANEFILQKELPIVDYKFTEKEKGHINTQFNEPYNIVGITMSKNYVILLANEYPSAQIQVSKKAKSKVIVLSKKLKQLNTIAMGSMVHTITSNCKSDTLYLVIKEKDKFILANTNIN